MPVELFKVHRILAIHFTEIQQMKGIKSFGQKSRALQHQAQPGTIIFTMTHF